MMENFFSIRKSSGQIFEGLAITEHEDFCKEWMNQYPVLFISFVKRMDFDVADKVSDLDRECDKAIKQIIDEKYAEGLYGYEKILCYGIAFFHKQAKVKLQAGK